MRNDCVLAGLCLGAVACVSCSGSSPTSSTVVSDDTLSSGVCERDYYQAFIGVYEGTLSMLESGATEPRVCQWNSRVEITGGSLASQCVLRAVTEASVTQSTFYPDDEFRRFQCLDDSGERRVDEPNELAFFDPTSGVGLSALPVQFSVSSNTRLDSGPYFGDENVTANYINLFDGQLSTIVDTLILEPDLTISVRDSQGTLLGVLDKEQ